MAEAIYCFDTGTVRFAFRTERGERVVAEIREDPLRDLFGAKGGGETLVAAYVQNADLIDERARELQRNAGGRPVVLETADFELSAYDSD